MSKDAPPQKSLESWIWAAACSIRGAKDAPKFKDFNLPLILAKLLCDVYDDYIMANPPLNQMKGRTITPSYIATITTTEPQIS